MSSNDGELGETHITEGEGLEAAKGDGHAGPGKPPRVSENNDDRVSTKGEDDGRESKSERLERERLEREAAAAQQPAAA